MLNNKLYQASTYCLFLIPIVFVIGIAVTETLVLLITFYFFYENKHLEFYKNKIIIFLIFFSIYAALNGYLQIGDNLKYSSIFHIRYVFLSIAVFFILERNKKVSLLINNKFLNFFIVFLFFIFFDSFFQFFNGKNIFGFEMYQGRVTGIFNDEAILGSFLIKLLPLVMLILILNNFDFKRKSIFLYFFLGLYFLTIYLAAGRVSFFLLLFFYIFIILMIKNLRKIYLISLGVMIFFIITFSFLNIGKSNPFDRIFVLSFNQITNHLFYDSDANYYKNKENLDLKKEIIDNIKIYSNHHQGHYIVANELFKKNPFFGAGPKGFRFYCRKVDYAPPYPNAVCSTHPHNIVVQILSETGLVGFFFYFFSILFIILNILKLSKKRISSVDKNCFLLISVALLMNFFPFLPSGNFFNNWISITNYYYIGFYLYYYKKIYKN